MSQSSIVNRKSSIYILHGWTYSKSKWAPFVSLLKKRGLTPILVNIPGLTEKINKPWNIEDYNNWLYKKLKKEKEKIILIGHSNGGRIAMAFSIKYPEKVKKLILIDSAGIHHDEFYINLKRKVFGLIAKTGKKILNIKLARDLLYALTGEVDYKEASGNMKKTMINMVEFDKNLNLSEILAPTVIIWGKNDGITPFSDGKTLEKLIVNSKLFVVSGARHSPQFTHPQEVAEIIKQFSNETI
ncbi:MAG: hypothetical protein A2860_04625 [Candidatus Levybacteria bacterium RIFCSPHIGHO2_01_FULL_37_33]|nr:MAG: hypothetical protein A2860_04625 [Candidatus Levybacteria bacterium RIFCSPHIGHO2_01_FULL_37_33]OGH29232.1 MAG: hypothetical protein A3F30_03280 [Candidatus Levybacteria bacterium RIFCSPHIGHO2_12_FULL_37_12]OGH33094.1 MAG: hypothetical protein A2953_03440 [Candidatus Levybacteria bacterium RIFCSPLOWO2_01_FULL_36_54]